ncbi:MAG: hypothetical protein DRO93_05015 [Candidatus Thorarchaeota archaeon]|nr:MAG: hypothetical protein DRO93_05015 [Candidatus Thorarchaeota archaeon]
MEEERMTYKLAELESILRDLTQKCDLESSAIVTTRGQMVCSSLSLSTTEKAISAMAASIQSIGVRVGKELGAGMPEVIIIDGAEKTVILTGFGSMILIGTAPVNSGIALIKFELVRAVERIKKVLNE